MDRLLDSTLVLKKLFLKISYTWTTCRSLAINGIFIARGVEIEPYIVLL